MGFLLHLVDADIAGFVDPVRRHAGFSNLAFPGTNLDFNRRAMGPNKVVCTD